MERYNFYAKNNSGSTKRTILGQIITSTSNPLITSPTFRGILKLKTTFFRI